MASRPPARTSTRRRSTRIGLRELPGMSKDELMAQFDQIATDPRVTLSASSSTSPR